MEKDISIRNVSCPPPPPVKDLLALISTHTRLWRLYRIEKIKDATDEVPGNFLSEVHKWSLECEYIQIYIYCMNNAFAPRPFANCPRGWRGSMKRYVYIGKSIIARYDISWTASGNAYSEKYIYLYWCNLVVIRAEKPVVHRFAFLSLRLRGFLIVHILLSFAGSVDCNIIFHYFFFFFVSLKNATLIFLVKSCFSYIFIGLKKKSASV